MAEQIQNEQKPIPTANERILEAAVKSMEKKTAEITSQKLDQGQDPNQVLSDLMGSINKGISPQELSKGIDLLSQSQTPIKGSSVGILPALFNKLGGGEYNPNAPRTEAIGRDKAIKQLKSLIDIQQAPAEQQFEQQTESRRRLDSDRRLRQEKVDNIKDFGGTIDLAEQDVYQQETGLNLESLMMQGRANKSKDGGKANIMSDQAYNRMISEGKFSPTEQQKIQIMTEELNSWGRVINKMEDLGIKEGEKLFDVEMEEETNPLMKKLGFTSVPAWSKLARRMKGNERLEPIAKMLEQAFQKYRIRVTGAQASDKEIERLRTLVAGLTDNPGVFFDTIRNTMEGTKDDFNIMLDWKEKTGRDVKKYRTFMDELPQVKKSGVSKEDKLNKEQDTEYQEYLKLIGGQ